MRPSHELFVNVIGGIVLAAFGAGIGVAAYYSGLWGAPVQVDKCPGIISYFVSTANTTLAANLGAVLGINLTTRGWSAPESGAGRFQWFAAMWYVGMLALAAVLWGMLSFKEKPDEIVALLPELTRSAAGIFVAILAAMLGVQTALAKSREQERVG